MRADPPHAPDRISELPLRSWPDTLKRTAQRFFDDHMLQWAGALTFFAMLSLFPAILALAAFVGVIGAPIVQPLIDNVSEVAPGPARDLTLSALRSIEDGGAGSGSALFVAVAVALWSASAYVGAFIPAANVVWGVDEARPIWRKLIVRVLLTLVLLSLVVVTALGVVLTGPIARQAGNVVGLGDAAVDVWGVAKWPALMVAMMGLLTVLYWTSPNVRHPGVRWVTPGSVLAVALWVLGSLAFTTYVANFASYNATYGAIGGILVFLLWLWISNIAILLGAELNAEIERTRAIEGGMRPADRTPFLPLRDTPTQEA